jgi:hypothetical protein
MPQDGKFTDLYRSARMNAEIGALAVEGQRISSYRIDNANQAANISAVVTISTEESSAGWACADTGAPEHSASHWAAGGGAGGPCITPPSPSANAAADIETTRRQVAKNRASLVMVLFVLFIGEPLHNAPATSDVIERANNSTASNHRR